MPSDLKSEPPFADYADAAAKLMKEMPLEELAFVDPIIVTLSAGGVAVAWEVARKLGAEVEYLFIEKIKAPRNKECEIAVISESEDIVIHDELIAAFEINKDYIYGEAFRKYEERILPNIYTYRSGQSLQSFEQRSVLLVDAGIQSGMVMEAAIKSCVSMGARNIMVAVPVVSRDIAEHLETISDQLFTALVVDDFIETDFYYETRAVPTTEALKSMLRNPTNEEDGDEVPI